MEIIFDQKEKEKIINLMQYNRCYIDYSKNVSKYETYVLLWNDAKFIEYSIDMNLYLIDENHSHIIKLKTDANNDLYDILLKFTKAHFINNTHFKHKYKNGKNMIYVISKELLIAILSVK